MEGETRPRPRYKGCRCPAGPRRSPSPACIICQGPRCWAMLTTPQDWWGAATTSPRQRRHSTGVRYVPRTTPSICGAGRHSPLCSVLQPVGTRRHLLPCRGRTDTGPTRAAAAGPASARTLTAMLTFPRISSGILLASFSTWSREPPSWGQHRVRKQSSEQAVGGAAPWTGPRGPASGSHENSVPCFPGSWRPISSPGTEARPQPRPPDCTSSAP